MANLARLLRERGDLAGAVEVVGRAIAAARPAGSATAAGAPAGDPRWLLERGLAHTAASRLEAALADFLAAADAATRRPATEVVPIAVENAAQAAYRLGRFPKAAGLYRRLADLDPACPDPWKTLGAIQLYDLHDPAAARASFQRALAVEIDAAERAQIEALFAGLPK